jgi:hypothetical protein
VTDSTAQAASREKPGFWVPGRLALRGMQMAVATILLTLIGPFGTFTDLTLPWRGLYWAIAILCGFIILEPTIYRVLHLAFRRNWHWPSALTVSVLAAALPLTAAVLVLETLMRRPPEWEFVSVVYYYFHVLTITIVVGGLPTLWELYRHGVLTPLPPQSTLPAATEERTPGTSEPPGNRLLNRLALERRGGILALSMEDHYVRIFTDAGESLILLRLSDAMAEVRDVRGLQIHRSHWVAAHAVDRTERLSDGRLRVHLVNGLTLPVSRTFARAVREAGLGKEINGS